MYGQGASGNAYKRVHITQVRNILGAYAITKCHIHAKNKHTVYQSNQPDKIKQSKNTCQIITVKAFFNIVLIINVDSLWPWPLCSQGTKTQRGRDSSSITVRIWRAKCEFWVDWLWKHGTLKITNVQGMKGWKTQDQAASCHVCSLRPPPKDG